VNATKITNAVNATNPQKIETVLPERELVAQRSREFDDPPLSNPTRNLPNTNPTPPPFPNNPGPSFPVRRPDFDGFNTNSQFFSDKTAREIRYKNVTIRELREKVIEVSQSSSNGCKVTRVLNGSVISPYVESIKIKPLDNNCTANSVEFYFEPTGNIIKAITYLGETLVVKFYSQSMAMVKYIDSSGYQYAIEVPYLSKQKSDKMFDNFKQNKSSSQYIAVNLFLEDLVCGLCKTTKFLGDIMMGKNPFEGDLGKFYEILRKIGNPFSTGLPGSMGGAVDRLLTSFPSVEKAITGTTDLELNCSSNLLSYTGESFRCDNKKDDLANQGSQLGKDIGSQQGEQITRKSQQQEIRNQNNNKSGSSYGDPHIVTFDGYRYSFQTIGEFTLVKSVDGSFEVQTRQSPVLNAQLSMNSAVAIKAGNSRIAIYGQGLPDGDSSTPIRVDGRPFLMQGGTLPNGTAIVQQGQGSYVVQLPTGEVISARRIQRNNLSYMDVNPSVPSSRQYIGLLGNANGNPADDLQMRNGQIIETKQTYGQIAQTASSFIPGLGRISGLVGKVENLVFAQLYREFGNSWRISQAESLFDYKPGQSTETFTDRGFPSSYKTLDMLSAAQIEAATTACRQANVPAEQLEGCIFDVGFTGDTGFAQTASEALGLIRDIGKLIPGGIPIPTQIPLPVRIPGLPF
jgi:hypothetical protein